MAKLRLLDASVQNWTVPANIMPDTLPAYQQGAIYYANDSGLLQAADFQSGATLWTTDWMSPGPLNSPVWINGVIYLATDLGQLYAINPVTGAAMWTQPVTLNSGGGLSTPQFGQGYVAGAGQQSVLYIMDAQNLYLVPLQAADGAAPTPQTVYSTPSGVSLGTSLAYDANTGYMLVNTSNGLSALNADLASDAPWTSAWDAALGGYVTPVVTAMGKAYVGTPGQTLALVGIASGEVFHSASLSANIEQPVLVYPNSNTVFVPMDSGMIALMDATSAAKVNQIQPGQQITTPLMLSDNLVYFGSADQNVYSFDVTAPTGNVISYQADSAIAYLAGVSSGSAYFGTGQNMHSADFATVIHQFNSQSQLMSDVVPAGQSSFLRSAASPTSVQQVPAYQSQIQLFDEENNVRPNQAVKVWSVTPATLMTDNQTFSIGPDTPAAFQSDAAGKVNLSVQASTDIQAGVGAGLSTPALMLWASFMDPAERILIYPDQRLHAQLQSMTGADVQKLTTYNHTNPTQPGTPLMPSAFQGSDGMANANALASAVNNTINLQKPSLNAVKGADETKYLAFPETMLGVSYAPTAPDTSRAPQPGAVPNWSLDLTSGAAFTPHGSQAEATLFADGFRAARGLKAPEGFFSDIVHFISNVIHGVEDVVMMTVHAVENVLNAVIHTAENVYNLVVTTIEDAAHLVLGFFKSLIKDIEQVVEAIIEALSWLFDWEDILVTHRQIKSLINTAFSQTTTLISQVQGETDAFFTQLKGTITSDFQSLINQVTGTQLGPATQHYNDPNQAYAQGSNNYTVQGNWMYHKSMSNAVGTNGSVSVGGASNALTAAQESLPQQMEAFLAAIATDALHIAEDLGDLILASVKELVEILTDPQAARTTGLATLLGDLQNLLVNIVQLGQDASDALFGLVEGVVSLIQAALNASIDIPLISDFYKWITGDSLTILDLFSLIVAIPVTIIYKVITGHAPYSSSEAETFTLDASASSIMNMIATFNGVIYAFVDAISNAMGNDSPNFLNYVQAVLYAIAQAVSIPLGYSGDQLRDYLLLWLYQWFPTIWATHSGMEGGAGNPVSNLVMPFYGIGAAIWQAVYAIMYPADYFDDGIKLVQNELGAFSTIAGFAKLSDNEDVLMVMTAACFFLDMGSALIEIKYWNL